MRINWRLIIGIAFSALALFLIFQSVDDPAELIGALRRANYLWLIPAALLLVATMWVRGLRWMELLNRRLPAARAFSISNVGNLLNNVLPLRLGELSRAYLASRNSSISVMQSLSTVIVERLLDVLFVFAMLLLVFPLVPNGGPLVDVGTPVAAMAVIGVVGMFIAAAVRERVMGLAARLTAWLKPSLREVLLHRADDFLRGVSAASGRQLVNALILSAVLWVGYAVICYMTLLAFVPEAKWYMGVFTNCALALGLTLPSSPSGAGIYEAAGVFALGLFDVPTEVAFAFTLVLHVATFLEVAVFGVIGLDREGESFGHLAAAAQNLMTAKRNDA